MEQAQEEVPPGAGWFESASKKHKKKKNVETYENHGATIQHLLKYVSDKQIVADQVNLITTRSTTISML